MNSNIRGVYDELLETGLGDFNVILELSLSLIHI